MKYGMARLPDRFDLWVRKARESADTARQLDYVLGALAGLPEWHFFNVGTKENPQPAEADIEDAKFLLVFSDTDRIEELFSDARGIHRGDTLPVITIPTDKAMPWCLERRAQGCDGLLVNPGDDACLIAMEQVALFYDAWSRRSGRLASGFWIPNMTSEEEDFWQENGL